MIRVVLVACWQRISLDHYALERGPEKVFSAMLNKRNGHDEAGFFLYVYRIVGYNFRTWILRRIGGVFWVLS